jgi:hypothetical protein
MLVAEKPQMESIIDKRVSRKTKRKEYFEYLVKWKGHPTEYASWEDEAKIQKHGQTVQEVMKIFKRGSIMQEHHKHPAKQA